MLSLRRKKRVQPFVDEYILRRYEDTAVLINADLRSEMGLQNHYAPWLESKLQGFPEPLRKKYSLLRTPPTAGRREEAGPGTSSTTERGVTEPGTRGKVARESEARWEDGAVALADRGSGRGEFEVSNMIRTDQQPALAARGNNEGAGDNSITIHSKLCIIL